MNVQLSTRTKALELTEVDYDGVRWAHVDFLFDVNGRLASLAMHTRAVSFEKALDMARRQEAEPDGVQDADYPSISPAKMQIRVCEDDDGEITFAYERVSVTS